MRYRNLFEKTYKLKTLTGDKLIRFLNDSDRRKRDPNYDWHKRFRYMYPSEMRNEIYFVHFDGDRVISNLALQMNPYDEGEYWLKHVDVDGEYRNQGLATELYQAAIDFLRQEGKTLKRSSPSKLGQRYLTRVVDRLKQSNPDVEIRDSDK